MSRIRPSEVRQAQRLAKSDARVIRVVGLVSGAFVTPYDGQFLVEYDPERDGVAPNGLPMTCHLVTTPDPKEARQFTSMTEAFETWRMVSKREPVRVDGRPNRPLTAFSCEFASPDRFLQ